MTIGRGDRQTEVEGAAGVASTQGLTIDGTATILEDSAATVERDLAFGKAWWKRTLDTASRSSERDSAVVSAG